MKQWTDNTPDSSRDILDVVPVAVGPRYRAAAARQWTHRERADLLPVLILSLILLIVVSGGLVP